MVISSEILTYVDEDTLDWVYLSGWLTLGHESVELVVILVPFHRVELVRFQIDVANKCW